MLPTRVTRFCCEKLKESYGVRNERIVTGVRRYESANRNEIQGVVSIFQKGGIPDQVKNSKDFEITKHGGARLLNYDNDESVQMVYTCFRTNKVLVNPLINWTDDDVWRYIRDEKIEINPLYECGFWRIGCIGCPMAQYKQRVREFDRYPKYRERFIHIADRIVHDKKGEWLKKDNTLRFKNGLDYFRRWMEDPNVKGQLSFDMDGNITEDYT